MRKPPILAAALLLLVACDKPKPGDGPHEYASTPGTATIRSMDVAGRILIFDFRPADPAAAGAAERVSHDLPSDAQAFIDRNALEVGKSIPCVRKDRTRGTTAPLVWEFPSLKW